MRRVSVKVASSDFLNHSRSFVVFLGDQPFSVFYFSVESFCCVYFFSEEKSRLGDGFVGV